MKKQTTVVLKLIAALAFITSCTKTRQAELPDDVRADVYAISEFGTTDGTSFSASKLEVDQESTARSVKALDQSATLSSDDVSVPARLKFMFDKLPMSGQTAKKFNITFTVDKDNVTAYKIVQSSLELSVLECGLAITLKEAQLLAQATRSTSADAPKIFQSQKAALTERQAILAGQSQGLLAVPMFKYKVEGYGIVERTKNEMKENTSVLTLKTTDFKSATHIKISSKADSRLLVGMNADQIKDIDQLYDEKKIDNLATTAGDLQSKLKIGLGFLPPETKIFTRLDASVMHIYKITKVSALNEFGASLLKNKSGNQQVMACSDAAVAVYFQSAEADCVLELAADLQVSYVSSKLTLVDAQGNTSNKIQFDNVPRSQSVGLVSITENTAASVKYISGLLDPKNSLKISDLKDKEFFFRRTFEDAPSTSMLMPGLAGDLILAKFVLEDSRIVVQASEKFINYKNENSNQFEELMSIGATYYKVSKVDASGTTLTIPKVEQSSRYDADYVVLDWTNNSLPIVQSPLSMTTYGQCLSGISNTKVSDVYYANDNELILNFTYNYTAVLRQECATYYDTQNYNGGDSAMQQVHSIRERISFRENKIKKADEKIVSSQVPFPAQNKMGYGLFTKAVITPTENGTRTLENGQLDLPIIHDFTNGQKLVYTIGGLADNDPQRQMVIDLTKEVVADWNAALHISFKGTSLDRAGDYIEAVVNGKGSEKAFLGDTNKNFLWYDDKINEGMSVIGVSQAGSHPRTGTIIADQVVMYLGNSRSYIEATLRAANLAKQYQDMITKFKKDKIAEVGAKTSNAAQGASAAPAGASSKSAAQINFAANLLSPKKSLVLSPMKIPAVVKAGTLPADALSQFRNGSGVSDAKVNLAKISANAKQMPYMKEFFARITEQGSDFTSSDVDALLAREILKSNGQAMTTQQKSLLKLHVQLAEAKSNLKKIFANRPGCVTFKDAADYTSKFTGMNFNDALRISLKATLAHEMGHSLGLTHNFIASSDKANWDFDKEKTGRNYSSIMDYQDEARQTYVGAGPYDVHALRAGYTGLVELKNKANGIKADQVIAIDGKNFVNVNVVKTLLANGSWSSLDQPAAMELLKNYKYCTDKDLMWEADCRQFDLGGSATEIVNNAIADYNERYGVSRFGYDRREFSWVAKARVIGRSYDSMLHIRQYLDELFYKLIVERSSLTEVQVQDYLQAADAGWGFFHQVLGTADAPAVPFLSADRFAIINAAEDGAAANYMLVEQKKLRDSWISNDRLESIGIEEDKIIAMQLLTLRGLPYPKYLMHSFSFSYLDFEKYFTGAETSFDMRTVKLMKSMVTNILPAFAVASNGQALRLAIKNEITDAMRFYVNLNAVLGLQAQTLTEKDNFGNLFKVGSTLGATLDDRISLSRLDNPAKSKAATYFWAPDNSSASAEILESTNRNREILDHAADLEKPMKAAILAFLNTSIEGEKSAIKAVKDAQTAGIKEQAALQKVANDAFQAKVKELTAGKTAEQLMTERKIQLQTAFGELQTAIATLNKDGLVVTKEKAAANPDISLDFQLPLLARFLQKSSLDILNALNDTSKGEELAGRMQINTDVGTEYPLLAIAQKAFLDLTADTPGHNKLVSSAMNGAIIETNDNLIMKNIEFLNMLTVIVNPGFNR